MSVEEKRLTYLGDQGNALMVEVYEKTGTDRGFHLAAKDGGRIGHCVYEGNVHE